MTTKATTLRLTNEQYEELQLIAHVLGVSMNQLICEAIAEYLVAKAAQPGFLKKMEDQIAKDQEMLARLTGEK